MSKRDCESTSPREAYAMGRCAQIHQAGMAKTSIVNTLKVPGLTSRWEDDVISNGVPPPAPPPEVALSLGVFSVV